MIRVGLCFSLLFIITACGDNSTDDLKDFVAEIKARPSNRIQPFPVINGIGKFPIIIIDQNQFTALDRRTSDIPESTTCYSPTERRIPHLLKAKSIKELTFLRYSKSRWTFNVTIWDGEEMAVYQKNTLISQESWQILGVDERQVTLGKLDKCSQVIEKKSVTFSDK